MNTNWVVERICNDRVPVLRQGNVYAHYQREDGVYAIYEFGDQAAADRLNAAGHVGQTVPKELLFSCYNKEAQS